MLKVQSISVMKLMKPSTNLGQRTLPSSLSMRNKLCIATHSGYHILAKKDITHLIADSNYTIIHLPNSKIVCSQTLSCILKRLCHPRFIRIHQSFALNLEHLHKVDRGFTTAQLNNGVQLAISRSRKQLLKASINERFD